MEEHVAHSTALHSRLRERGAYLCGPLARYALNSEKLSPLAREAAAEAGLGPVCRNPFRSIVVRSVEILYALDEALRLIAAYEEPDAPRGRGGAARRHRLRLDRGAARACCWHRYRLDEDGTILEAKIVPPTSQNQAHDRGRPARLRGRQPRPRRRPAAPPLRAGDPQLRPLHLLRDPLPDARGRAG